MVRRPSAVAALAAPVACAALAALGLLACTGHRSEPAGVSATPTSTGVNPAPSAPQGETMLCKSDADCPVLACGPCDPGKVLTTDMEELRVDCKVDPCLHNDRYCNPQHLCAVSPKAEKRPTVWGLDAGAAGGKGRGTPGSACGCQPADLLCEMRCAEKDKKD